MEAVYVQTIVRQEIKIGTERIAFTIPECNITNVILSKDILSVKENINTILSQLKMNFSTQKVDIFSNFQEIDLNSEFKIGESKEIKIHIFTFDSRYLYKIHIMKTTIGYALNK